MLFIPSTILDFGFDDLMDFLEQAQIVLCQALRGFHLSSDFLDSLTFFSFTLQLAIYFLFVLSALSALSAFILLLVKTF